MQTAPQTESPAVVSSAAPDAKLAPSRFLDLPAELRNTIYALVLSGKTIHIHLPGEEESWYDKDAKLRSRVCVATESDDRVVAALRKPNSDQLEVETYGRRHKVCGIEGPRDTNYPIALLTTCRQVYTETKDLPLSSNTFSFQEDWDIGEFFGKSNPYRGEDKDRKMARQRCDHVRSIILGEGVESSPYLGDYGIFKNLKHVKIFKTTFSRELEDVETRKWQVTGRYFDDYATYNNYDADEIEDITLNFKPMKFESVSVCLHYGTGSEKERTRRGLPEPPRDHLETFRREVKSQLMKRKQE